MYLKLSKEITRIQNFDIISIERKAVLQPFIDYIQNKVDAKQSVNINFICTHNSRRSQLSQIWAQVAAVYFNIPNVQCYSGGTEATALFPKIVKTLINQGFNIQIIADNSNPIYTIKYDENQHPIIGFSKKYDDKFNPISQFVAIMTCSQADGDCPFIPGTEKRISIPFEDPKISDGTPQQNQVYEQISNEIATEMMYVFSQITK
ncbi:arsenate reductase [Chishuiella changwenlii]|uniref:Arsenate reductase n=1 Tax=Chishuiella changwenlii TaxID=1434701 RepID=A0A1M6ZYE2_9FLAO|nr:protein-tyrosine-phosphatase [Chishuiella changwenlii]GGE92179.1 arsenate reductase [Chishuiella changwenlii]SHL35507.1 arsenate reductase [Chishuiella changwenlii]